MKDQRKEIMLKLIALNNVFIDVMNAHFSFQHKKDPIFTPSWLDEKYDRFYIVESSTHSEEDFSVNMELRYGLRSGEIRKYGEGHDAFHKGYLSTTKFGVDEVFGMTADEYRDMLANELSKAKANV